METKMPVLFPITIFEKEKESETITRGRARIFYKYANRNGGYITDEFADELIKTLPGSPVKGIYNEIEEDYTDHGRKRVDGRAYGFVPETTHNISYEEHLDEDGVTRTYVCADVILWTALYEEAKDIIGAPQSMELYEPSITGSWKIIDGKRLYEYKTGSFLGLQALGKNVEPCFEGAAFYSLFSSLSEQSIKDFYKIYSLFQSEIRNNKGGKNMPNTPEMVFRLSDEQKENAIFRALNTEGCRYYINAVYDDCAIVFDFREDKYFSIRYTKNDDDTVTIAEEKTDIFAEWVSEDELAALKTIRDLKGTFVETLNSLNEQQTQAKNADLKIEELNNSLSTLEVEKGEIVAALETANKQVLDLTKEIEELKSFKVNTEMAEKNAIIGSYANTLDATVLDEFRSKVGEYTAIDLKKELAFALVESNPAIFTQGTPKRTPKEAPLDGLTAALTSVRDNK